MFFSCLTRFLTEHKAKPISADMSRFFEDIRSGSENIAFYISFLTLFCTRPSDVGQLSVESRLLNSAMKCTPIANALFYSTEISRLCPRRKLFMDTSNWNCLIVSRELSNNWHFLSLFLLSSIQGIEECPEILLQAG
jgi:hypothetical protein